ncbi:F-box only protein 44-like [Engraulis encrasicolus]|uniref:F-box only protein 44-like n=1 Tax=Engraulis encrasicolus TaxID=184585 RepID=UPI002FD168CA
MSCESNMKRRHMGNSSTSGSSKTQEGEQVYTDVPALPLGVLEEIFHNVPPEQLVCRFRLVCHEWRETVDSACLWKERCRREGFEPKHPDRVPSDWRLFYFLCKNRRNLLKNPKAEEGFSGWEILENGGDKWKVEDVMMEHPDDTITKNFVTSYFSCMKCQVIDLEAEGYSASFMDEFQPSIRISDWYAPRWDCGSEYEMRVELLGAKKKKIITSLTEKETFQQWNDQKWTQVTRVFTNYGKGVRYIRFTHGGKDTQFWAGWYGIRVTNSSVEICPLDEKDEVDQSQVTN